MRSPRSAHVGLLAVVIVAFAAPCRLSPETNRACGPQSPPCFANESCCSGLCVKGGCTVTDAGTDASVDAGVDGDAGLGADAGTDAGADAGLGADAGTDAGPLCAWSAATFVNTAIQPGDTGQPRVAVDTAGNAIVVWAQKPDGGTNAVAWATRYVYFTNSWDNATMIPGNQTNVSYPCVAVGQGGNAIAAWQDVVGSEQIAAARFNATGAYWSDAGLLTSDAGQRGGAACAIAPDRNAIVVFHQKVVSFEVWARSLLWDAGLVVDPFVNLSPNTGAAGGADDPSVAIAPSGDAIAGFEQWEDAGFSRAVVSRYSAGLRTWAPAQAIDGYRLSGDSKSVRVGLNGVGNGFAAWEQFDGPVNRIWVARFLAASGWDDAGSISWTAEDAGDVQLAVGALGQAAIAWRSDPWDAGAEIRVSLVNLADGQWGTAETLASNLPLQIRSPRVAVDQDGRIVVAWLEQKGSIMGVYARTYSQTTRAWSDAGRLDGNVNIPSQLSIAAGRSNTAVAVWREEEASPGGTRIAAAVCR